MRYTPAQVALLVRRHGGTDEECIFLASITPGESGGDPAIVNDAYSCGKEGGRVLHAVGLFQICDYSTRGTREQLQDPDHNAEVALGILRSQGEGAWTATPDQSAAMAATLALQGDDSPMAMLEWMPGVDQIDRGGSVPVQDDGPTVVVLHTTESGGPAVYDGTEPHFEVFDTGSGDLLDGTRQFISLAHTAKALYNAPGGGETNRRRGRIIQIEIVWRAANAPNMPDSLLRRVAAVVAFVRQQFPDLRMVAPPQGFHGAEFGTIAIVNSPLRFTVEEWEAFGGICGHQHVIENDHWDPGRIDIDKLIAFVGGADEEDPFMALSAEQQEDLLDTTKATNDEVGKMAPIIRDSVGGLPARLNTIESQLREILALLGKK